MSPKIEELSLFMNKLGLQKEAERIGALLALASEEELPKRFPLAFRYWIRDFYYKHNINQTYSPKWKGITANSLFKKESEYTRKKIYEDWKLIRDAEDDKASKTRYVVAYHGSSVPIQHFDRDKSAMGIFWFSDDKGAIERGERANRTDWLITARLDVGNKIAGWDEYNKLGLYELERQFDSVHLDGDWIIFDPSKIKILETGKIDRSRPSKAEGEGEQMDLFGGLKSDVIKKIQKLSHWLHNNHLQKESLVALGLLKTSAGKPMPIDKAELEAIADELLEKVGDKLIGMESVGLPGNAGRAFSPSDLHDHMLGSTPSFFKETDLDPLMDTRAQNLSDYLETSITREKKNIRGDNISVTYNLVFKDQGPREPDSRGAYQSDIADPSKKDIYIFYSPNRYLRSAILKYRKESGNPDGSPAGDVSFEGKVEGFKESLRPYIVNTLMHEEVHALDVINKDKRNAEKHKVLNPEGESLDYISKKLEVDGLRIFQINYNKIIDEVAPFIEPAYRLRAVKDLEAGDGSSFIAIYDQVRSESLGQSLELDIPSRAESQIRIDGIQDKDEPLGSYRTKSLAEIAEQTGIKGGVKRLLIVNFKNLFGSEDWPKSYQQVYDFIESPDTQGLYQKLIHGEIEEGEEVKLIPSYEELYWFDKGFYVSTKEEFKALMTEIMNELSLKFEQDPTLSISEVRPERLIDLSPTARELLAKLQINPVDELIKTPLGFLDKLKENRRKMFYSGINHIYYILKSKLAESEQVEDLKKEAEKARGREKRTGRKNLQL
jgi:hypothetical protein